jgi:hypothetical protein
VSHTVACTKEFWALKLDMRMNQGPAEGQSVNLVVHDAPGLGEDLAKDEEYLSMYREKLPSCDIILWISWRSFRLRRRPASTTVGIGKGQFDHA